VTLRAHQPIFQPTVIAMSKQGCHGVVVDSRDVFFCRGGVPDRGMRGLDMSKEVFLVRGSPVNIITLTDGSTNSDK